MTQEERTQHTKTSMRALMKQRIRQSSQITLSQTQSLSDLTLARNKQSVLNSKVIASSIKPNHIGPLKTQSLKSLSTYLESQSLLSKNF